MKRQISLILLLLTFFFCLSGCEATDPKIDYGHVENWSYLETSSQKPADVFFICPTVYAGAPDSFNMSMDDKETKSDFLGATNMQKGIYDGECRFFSPYYRQAGLNAYTLSEKEREPYLALAYQDVKAAFDYYLDHYNDGRPLVLAGFSQGADLTIRLLKDCFSNEELQNRLVACYAIGWRITEDELANYPHLRVASGEDDTGVIISFNSEAEGITDSLLIPAGTKTLSINPLNWKTDSTPAGKELNQGACFTQYSGNIETEIPHLTGAYIDPERGALKITDVIPEDYPPQLSIFESGVYHLYDYQFFYRNLQENVDVRVNSYLSQNDV